MEIKNILEIIKYNKDSYVQMIKSKHKSFYTEIVEKYEGNSFGEKLFIHIYGTFKCKNCGGKVKFLSFQTGYNKYCSRKCSNEASASIRSLSIRETYKKNHYNHYEIINCAICGEKFESLKYRNQKCCSTKCSGIYVSKMPDRIEKIKLTKLEKYGNPTYVNPDKAKKTCLEKYGVNNVGLHPPIKQKIRISFLKYYLHKLKSSNRLKNLIEPLFTESDFKSTFRSNIYPFKCKKCNSIFNDNLDDGRVPRCLKCYPILSGKSDGEREVSSYIKSIVNTILEENNKTILNGRELDIFLPQFNVAIEYDGLYWHGQVHGNKNSMYHLNKTNECNSKNIKLIHIFEDEWLYRQDIVKNRLKYILGVTSNLKKIHSRKCEIREVEYKEADIFLDEYHIQGSIKSHINLGLYYNNELISLATFGSSRISNGIRAISGEYELYRFCSKFGYSVRGGMSKLFYVFIINTK